VKGEKGGYLTLDPGRNNSMVSLIERDFGITKEEDGDHSVRGVYRHEEISSLGSCFGRSTKNGIDSSISSKDNFLRFSSLFLT